MPRRAGQTCSTTYAPARRSPRQAANGRARGCGRYERGSPSSMHRSSPTSPASTNRGDNWPHTFLISRCGSWPSAPVTSPSATPTAADPDRRTPRLGITQRERPPTVRFHAIGGDFGAHRVGTRRRHAVPTATVPYRAAEHRVLTPKERHDERHQPTILGNPTKRWRPAHTPRPRSTRRAAAQPRPRRTLNRPGSDGGSTLEWRI